MVSHDSDTSSNLVRVWSTQCNVSLQNEVERRLADLKNLNKAAAKGRVQSQRGGPGKTMMKKSVDWPQHFILTRAHKTRLTYDDLTITQWVSGFVRCSQE